MSRYMAFDFETTNLEYGNACVPANRIVMVAWKVAGEKVKDYYGPDLLEHRPFWEDLEATEVLIAQNAKFEAKWLQRLGFDPTGKEWYDTMLAERVKVGNRRTPLNLDAMCVRYGLEPKEDRVDTLMKMGVCPSLIDPRYLRARCRRDVRTTMQLAMRQLREFEERGL